MISHIELKNKPATTFLRRSNSACELIIFPKHVYSAPLHSTPPHLLVPIKRVTVYPASMMIFN